MSGERLGPLAIVTVKMDPLLLRSIDSVVRRLVRRRVVTSRSDFIRMCVEYVLSELRG